MVFALHAYGFILDDAVRGAGVFRGPDLAGLRPEKRRAGPHHVGGPVGAAVRLSVCLGAGRLWRDRPARILYAFALTVIAAALLLAYRFFLFVFTIYTT